MAETTTKLPAGRDALITLSDLRFGHDPLAGPDINARCSGRLDGIDELAGMINAQGLIRPLLVVQNPTDSKEAKGLFFVFAGNRRLAALMKLQPSDIKVRALVYDADAPLYELSIADNEALPPHPVDRFRAFATLLERQKIDKPEDQVAFIVSRFGLSKRDAERALALSALDDSVLVSWRDGLITAAQARVFTLQPNKKAQAKLLRDRIGDEWRMTPSSLRDAIQGDRGDASRLVAFVGRDVYLGAGGTMTEDLFGSDHVVHDPEIAKGLADEKLDAICADMVAAGWKWAEPEDRAPSGWRHGVGFGRVPTPKLPKDTTEVMAAQIAALTTAANEADAADDHDSADVAREEIAAIENAIRSTAYKPKDMAGAGCYLSITPGGRVNIEAGVIKPAEKKAAATQERAQDAKRADKGDKPKAEISAAMADRLSTALTTAAAITVAEGGGDLALRLLLAGFAADGYGGRGPVCVSNTGMGSGDETGIDETFGAALAKANKLTNAAAFQMLAKVVASAIDLRTNSPTRLLLTGKGEGVEDEAGALAEALPQEELQAALRKAFTPADYFENSPSAYSRAALVDMKIDVPKGVTKASALAEIATTNAKKTGWLPPQLRTSGYEGPAADAKKPAKAKASKAKAKKRR